MTNQSQTNRPDHSSNDPLEAWVNQQFDTLDLEPLPDHFIARTMTLGGINPPAVEPFKLGLLELFVGLGVALAGTACLVVLTLWLSGEWEVVWQIVTEPRVSLSPTGVLRLTIGSAIIGLLSFLLLLPSDQMIERLFRVRLDSASIF